MKGAGVVRRGRIKVDARRAVAKLRDHLLLDADTWPLEVVRVAVMGGATAVHVQHDADDLVVTFDGEAPADDVLPRLLDHALESSRDDRTRRLRLLAIAINASLSTRPARVEVTVGEDGRGLVATFEPALIGAAGDDAPGGRPTVEQRAVRLGPGRKTSVAARKGFGWGTFLRFATGRPLREAQLLADATRHTTIPVTLEPPLPAAAAGAPVLRLDLEPHGVPGGVLEVHDEAADLPRVSFLELGVVLAHVPLPSTEAVRTHTAGVRLPLAVRVDARSWATNASRSQVAERDARRVLGEVMRAIPAAARALARACGVIEDEIAGVVHAPDPASAERALAALACCAAASDDDGPLGFVLDLPIVRDAVGRPMSPRDLVALVRRAADSAGREPVFVHRGPTALHEELGPFAREVPWLRGHALDRLLDAIHVRDFAEVHEEVARGIRRRATLLALPETGPHVPDGPGELLRVRFEETSGDRAGLLGEIVIHLRGEPALLRVFVEGRPFAALRPDTVLPIDAAVTWPGVLRPDRAYESLVADGALDRAIATVLDRAARELAARADRLAAPDAPEAGRALARSALAASVEARGGPLAEAALWATAAGPATSYRALDEASRDGALCFVQHPPATPRAAADGRLVPVLDGADATRLLQALGRAVELIPYGPALGAADDRASRIDAAHRAIAVAELEAQGVSAAVAVPFATPTTQGLVTTAREGVVVRTHAGVLLSRGPLPGGAPALVVIEDDAIVPTPDWSAVRSAPEVAVAAPIDALVAAVEALTQRASAERSATAVAAPPPTSTSLAPRIADATVDDARAWALVALAAGRRTGKKGFGFAEPLASAPVVTVLDPAARPTPASIASIRQRHGADPVPFLRVPPDFPTLDWRPVLVERREDQALHAAALGVALADGEPELPRRRDMARVEQARRDLLARPVERLEGLPPGAAIDGPTAVGGLPGNAKSARALVGLRAGAAAPFTVRYAGRFLTEVVLDGPPPVAAIVDTPLTSHVDRWATLSAEGRKAACAAVTDAARALAQALVAGADDRSLAASPLGRPGALELVAAVVRDAPALGTALRLSSVLLPGALGEPVTLARAVHGEGPIVIARERFAAELAAQVVDPPVLLGPGDGPLEALLLALGPALDDVTTSLRRIARPDADVPARLDGAPLHLRMRASLAELGARDLEGEIEITDASTSTVRIVLHDGSVRSLSPELPFAIRVQARPRRIDTRGRVLRDAAEAIAEHARDLLERLAPHVAELPPVAGDALRATVLSICARGGTPRKALAEAPVFADASGRAWSLTALIARKIRATTAPPPYPATAGADGDDPAVLHLSEAAIAALRKGGVRLTDVTRELQLDREAEARARAPQVEAALAPALRRACLVVRRLDEGPRCGEVGLLAPGSAASAAIHVLVGRRPLCTVEAPEGWPIVAVWNDDRLRTNRRRDGLAPTAQARAITEAVAAVRAELVHTQLPAPPPDARGSLVVERAFRGLRVAGRLWLLDDGATTETRVRWSGPGGARTLQLTSPVAVAGYPAALPVGGDLFVALDGRPVPFDPSHAATLGHLVLDLLPKLLAERVPPDGDAAVRATWHAMILGAAVKPPPVRDATGRDRSGTQVLAELRNRGVLWATRHAGMAHGDFPDEAPAFVVLDDGASPLLDLLEDRAPSLVRELGGVAPGPSTPAASSPTASPPAATAAPDPAAPRGKRKRRRKRTKVAPELTRRPAEAPAAEAASDAPAAEPPASEGPSWLSRIGGGVKELLAGGPRTELPADHPVARGIDDAARRLGIEPSPRVFATPRGRPVRYEPEAREVLLVLDHPAIAALVARREVEVIAAAAVGEINRAVAVVTDAEEQRVIGELLAARAARA